MEYLLLNWILSALVLVLVARIVPGFRLAGFVPALLAVIVIGLVNATLGFVLRVVGFPLTILTLGIFLLVINAIVLKVAAALMPGFSIRGFFPAFIGAIFLSLLHFVLRYALSAPRRLPATRL